MYGLHNRRQVREENDTGCTNRERVPRGVPRGITKNATTTLERIDLVPGATPIARAPYWIALTKMQELMK